MTAPKFGDFRVSITCGDGRSPLRIHVRNLAEALAILGAVEAVAAYETVRGIRRDATILSDVMRFEPDGHGSGLWYPVEDWELDDVQRVLDAA